MEQLDNLRKQYLSDGYIVLKSIYTKEYISKIRQQMINLSNKDKYEILLDHDVQSILLNKKLISKIKKVLSVDKLLYFSDSNIVNHINPFKNRNGFHNDARGESQNIPFDDEYPIIRIGIYFEDYKNFSGGLKVKKRSHKYFIFNFRRILADTLRLLKIVFTKTRYNLSSLKLGKSVNLELEQGDVVIWNLRTHHCGTSRRLKLLPKICLQPFFERMLPKYLFLPTQYKQDRCSIFTTFAKNDLKNENILGYIKKKANFEKIKQIKSNTNLLNRLNKLDCELFENF